MPQPAAGRNRAALLGLLAACATGSPAPAQNVNSGVSIGPSQNASTPTPQAAPVTTPAVEHLFGDWGGVRTSLGNLGIDILFDNTNEFAGNVSGGRRKAATDAGQTALEIDTDWGKLAGLTGFSTHAVVVGRYGANLSGIMGDQLSPAQEIYGAGGNVVAHLVYLYGEQSLLNGRVDLAIGRMPVGNDFAASPLNCTFMNNALCGNPKALSGNIGGFTAWPSATWGGRLRVKPTADTYVQLGLFEVSQAVYSNRAGFRAGWKWSGAEDSGVEIPAEIAWQPRFGHDNLPGHYKLGVGYDTSSYPAFGAEQPSRRQHGRAQYWALADQMVARHGPGDDEGLILLAGYVHDAPETFVRSDEVFAGFVDRGFWRARPKDAIGFLFSWQRVSERLRQQEIFDLANGLPLPSDATGVQHGEYVFEVNYDIHVFRGVNFAPDFQYILHPNAQTNIPNAVVLGFKSHVSF